MSAGLSRFKAGLGRRFPCLRKQYRILKTRKAVRIISELIPDFRHYRSEQILYLYSIAAKRGFKDPEDYCRGLINNEEELAWLKEHLTLSSTLFFRGKDDWDVFRQYCLPRLQAEKQIRVWCAGCSSGEEVYSIILALTDMFAPEQIAVLATDYADELLEKCRAGTYPLAAYSAIPEQYRKYLRVSGEAFTFTDEIRQCVKTANLNLLTADYPADCSLVLCRNVLLFFKPAVRKAIHRKLAASVAKGGFLFLSTETDRDFPIQFPGQMSLHRFSAQCIYEKSGRQ
ncbi:MAG: hypothetical protein IJH44_05745 [Solobacterium sp.]|nr:hypothetical protein [Solobacterium sp.]